MTQGTEVPESKPGRGPRRGHGAMHSILIEAEIITLTSWTETGGSPPDWQPSRHLRHPV